MIAETCCNDGVLTGFLKDQKEKAMDKSTLAVDGGVKTIDGFEGRGDPKIGHEEFLEMADTWGYSSDTIDKIR
ncbi:MAG: hypothetical protein OXI86_19915, partial [Candidatus Poribacteria bacterium]|nr:hypothetical protein [Candidatus Poribacteria bacterium]